VFLLQKAGKIPFLYKWIGLYTKLYIVCKVCVFFVVVLFNDDVNCQDSVVSVVDLWISMEHWWNYSDGGKLKKSEILWPPQIPLGLSWDRTKTFMVETVNYLPKKNTDIWCVFLCFCTAFSAENYSVHILPPAFLTVWAAILWGTDLVSFVNIEFHHWNKFIIV
jgi:hypothetical protein